MKALAADITESDAEYRRLLARRDVLAREAIDAGVSWTSVRTALGLSKRGLQLVLSRTAPPEE